MQVGVNGANRGIAARFLSIPPLASAIQRFSSETLTVAMGKRGYHETAAGDRFGVHG
jgi:hypothetical protein